MMDVPDFEEISSRNRIFKPSNGLGSASILPRSFGAESSLPHYRSSLLHSADAKTMKNFPIKLRPKRLNRFLLLNKITPVHKDLSERYLSDLPISGICTIFTNLGRVGDLVDELIQPVNIYYVLPVLQNTNEKRIPAIKVIFST